VDRPGEEFFAGSRFAEHKDGQRRLGSFFEISIEAQEGGILGDDAELPAFVLETIKLHIAHCDGLARGSAQIVELMLKSF
jgi:hypothetical protein